MMTVTDWFSGFATPSGFLYFLAGFFASYLFKCISLRLKNKHLRVSWQFTGIVIGTAVIIISSLQTQIAYTTAKQTAIDVQNCQREYNAANSYIIKLITENDKLSRDRSIIVPNWFHDVVFPPPPYDKMDINDPVRQQYGLNITVDSYKKFKDLLAKQDALLVERQKHPLPDPTCGR